MYIKETPLKIIKKEGGDIKHIINVNSEFYNGFGETYISQIEPGVIKGWKLHKIMTCNLVALTGDVKIVVKTDTQSFNEYFIGDKNYARLTIPPGTWFAFKCISKHTANLLNFSDIPHDPDETESKKLNYFSYQWGC